MKKSLFAALLWFVFLSGGYAQAARANYWPLNTGVALDFSSGQPQLIQACALHTLEANSAICNDQGQLQLYSNGGGRNNPFEPRGTIWNKNHGLLYDMQTEGGGYSAKQGAIIIPAPGKPRHYYVLTMEESEASQPGQLLGNGFSAFLVNMDANGGLGAVVQYLPKIYAPSYEGMCAIQHPNCRDYWVVISDANTEHLMVFPVTPEGIGSGKRFNFSTPFYPVYTSGSEIRASPDAQHVQVSNLLFRFNPITGELSQMRRINADIHHWEFSPGSRYSYWYTGSEIKRIDILAPDPNTTVEVIANIGALGLGARGPMQLGPDGSIWFRTSTGNPPNNYLHAIRQPDAPDAFVETQVLTLPVNSGSIYSFPDFPAQWFATTPAQAPQVQLGPDLALCGDSLLLIPSGIVGFPVVWSTGDTLAALPVDVPGTYIATVLGCATTTDTIVVLDNGCACPIQIPNAFTPNGDQFNDTFGPVLAPEGFTMRIWNRWGQLVFQHTGTGPSEWDGTFNGQPAPSDVYVYQMIWESCGKMAKGEVALLR